MVSADFGSQRTLEVRPSRVCGMSDELLWLERRARAQMRHGDNGLLAISLAQISLKLSQLRRDHSDACQTCGVQPWIG
jgi:hypothetical protein